MLTEENFVKNIHRVIGEDEPFFGKMLYLWMAKGYDRVKISITQFIEHLRWFVDEDCKSRQLKDCFAIMDIDGDNMINILNIMHLNKNLKKRTLLSREV